MHMRKWLSVSNNMRFKRSFNGWLLSLLMACSVPAMASVVAEKRELSSVKAVRKSHCNWSIVMTTQWQCRCGWMMAI